MPKNIGNERHELIYYRRAVGTPDISSLTRHEKHDFSVSEDEMTKRYSHLVPETLKKAIDDVWKENKITLDKG